MRTKRRFRNRRNEVHLVWGSSLAQRLLHLLILQVRHGQHSLQQNNPLPRLPSKYHQLDLSKFCLHFFCTAVRLSALTNSGGEGIHHRRGGHHLPGVRQEEADGGHCGAVAPLLHPSILFSQTTTTTTTTTNRLLHCVRKLSHPLNANPLLQKLVSFLFLKRYLSKSAFRYSYPILKSLQACQLN